MKLVTKTSIIVTKNNLSNKNNKIRRRNE